MEAKKLEEVVDHILESLAHELKDAKDFTLKEAPQLAKEVVLRSIVSDSFLALIGAGLLFGGVNMLQFSIMDKEINLVVGAVLLVGTIFFLGAAHEIITTLVAPKLHVIEYVKNLLTKKSDNEE